MIGGMEDEYWAQQQREWDAWRAEQNDIWRREGDKSNTQARTGRYQEGILGNDGTVNDIRRI
jgi:hypothetical protein